MTRAWSPAGAVTSARCSFAACRAPGRQVRVLDLNDADDRPDASSSSRATSATGPSSPRRSTASTSCINNVAQVPLARDPRAAPHCQRRRHDTPARGVPGRTVSRKVVHTSSSAVFGVPGVNPVLPTTVPKPSGGVRTRQARSRVGLPGGCRRWASTCRSFAPAPSLVTEGWASSGSCSTGSPTVRRRSSSVMARTATSSFTPMTLPTRASAPADAPVTAIYNVGTDRFGTMREALTNLCEHAGTGATVRSLPIGPTAWG